MSESVGEKVKGRGGLAYARFLGGRGKGWQKNAPRLRLAFCPHTVRKQRGQVRGELCKVNEQRLVRAQRGVLGLAKGERVQEEGVALIRHLHVKHAVAAAGG